MPTLIIHDVDDQIVPIKASARRSVQLLRNVTLKEYPGAPHGLAPDLPVQGRVDADLLEFIKA